MLSITLDGAKWHVSELLTLTGLEDRKALADWWASERDRKAPVFVSLATSRWLALAAGVVFIVVAGFVLLRHDGSQPDRSSDPPLALGLDLPVTPTRSPTPTPPYPDAYYACPVTKPNGNSAPHHGPNPYAYGDGTLWTNLGTDGRFVFRGSGFGLQADGSIYVKWAWWASIPGGQFLFDAKRLDGPGVVSSATFDPASDGSGVPGWIGGPIFSDPGCWQITASLGGDSMTVVVFLQVIP